MKRKLTKSRTNVILTGTLGGIAEYFNIDATIVRIIFVLVTFGGLFTPVFLYILLALIIPSGRSNARRDDNYGHENPYYRSNSYSSQKKERKEAEKVDDDDWSDF